jgi:hypothetical protein
MKKLLMLEVILLNELMEFKDNYINEGPVDDTVYYETHLTLREWILSKIEEIKKND